MKKSIIKIFLYVLIVTLFLVINMIQEIRLDENRNNPLNIISSQSAIEFVDNQVIVKDIYEIELDESIEILSSSCPMALNLIEENEHSLGYRPEIIRAFMNGKEIILEEKNPTQKYSDVFSSMVFKRLCHIIINKLKIEKTGRQNIEITYAYDVKKVVEEYDDVCVMKMSKSYDEIKMTLPKASTDLKTMAYGTSAIKEADNVYSFNFKNKGSVFEDEVTITMEKGIIEGGKKIDRNYSENIFYIITQNKAFIPLIALLVMLSVCFVVSCVLTVKPKYRGSYVRGIEDLVSPLVAEGLIDGKIGAKECIMTCVLSAVKKGAIEIKDNDTIRLLTYDNTNHLEQTIIKLMFNDTQQQIRIKELKNIFVKDNIKSEKFYKSFLYIKNCILEEFKDRKIYNKTAEIILKIIRIISTLIFVNILPIMACFTELGQNLIDSDEVSIYIGVNVVVLIISIILTISDRFSLLPPRTDFRIATYIWVLIPCIALLYIMYIFAIVVSSIVLIVTTLLFVINFITYKNSKKHMLTKKGKEEYKKVLGLKRYLEDYSIMHERDMQEIILWDDYLIYATAFGIPNRVTNKFAEALFNTNINLQKINRLLGM